MKIVILTQNDPFYLADEIDYFLSNIPEYVSVESCFIFDVSPFGRKETFLQKSLKTLRTFGIRFFARYTIKYLNLKILRRNSVQKVLDKHSVKPIHLSGNINDQDNLSIIKSMNPDLLISIAGNQIFKNDLLKIAEVGCLNLHTALLPEYRGLMPSFWVLKNNESKTGVSVFFVDEGIDSGPILVQKEVEIGDMSLEELIIHTKRVGMNALLEAIEKIKNGNYKLIENSDSKSTYYSFPTRNDVKIFKINGKRFY